MVGAIFIFPGKEDGLLFSLGGGGFGDFDIHRTSDSYYCYCNSFILGGWITED